MTMATGSMISSVRIKGHRQVRRFAEVLEQADGSRGKAVKLTQPVKSVSDEELKEIVRSLRYKEVGMRD